MTEDIRELWPEPPRDLKERLQHFLDCYPDVPDQTVVLMSTASVYGRGAMTGLTMGDMRTLAGQQSAGAETVVYGPDAEWLGRQLRDTLNRERLRTGGENRGTAQGEAQEDRPEP